MTGNVHRYGADPSIIYSYVSLSCITSWLAVSPFRFVVDTSDLETSELAEDAAVALELAAEYDDAKASEDSAWVSRMYVSEKTILYYKTLACAYGKETCLA